MRFFEKTAGESYVTNTAQVAIMWVALKGIGAAQSDNPKNHASRSQPYNHQEKKKGNSSYFLKNQVVPSNNVFCCQHNAKELAYGANSAAVKDNLIAATQSISGLDVGNYRYFKKETNGLDLQGMLEDLKNLPQNSIVLLQIQSFCIFSMSENLKRCFIHPRPRMVDVNSLLKTNSHVAMRDPELFVKSVIDISKLKEPSAEGRTNQLIYKYFDKPVEEEREVKVLKIFTPRISLIGYYSLSQPLCTTFKSLKILSKHSNNLRH